MCQTMCLGRSDMKNFKEKKKTDFFERHREREKEGRREGEKKKLLPSGSLIQMAVTARAWGGSNQELRASSSSPKMTQGPKCLGTLVESWIGSGTASASTGAHMAQQAVV